MANELRNKKERKKKGTPLKRAPRRSLARHPAVFPSQAFPRLSSSHSLRYCPYPQDLWGRRATAHDTGRGGRYVNEGVSAPRRAARCRHRRARTDRRTRKCPARPEGDGDQTAFPHTGRERSRNEIKQRIPRITASERRTYSGVDVGKKCRTGSQENTWVGLTGTRLTERRPTLAGGVT